MDRLPRIENHEALMSLSTDIQNPTDTQDATADPVLKLEPILSQKWALGYAHVAITAYFALFFMYLSYQPLFHTDLWGHVAYGDWMIKHRALPTEDPFVGYAKGVPVIASAWLGQVILAGVQTMGGPEWISHLYTVVVWSTYVLLVGAFYWKSRQLGTAMLGMGLAFFLVWSRHATVRPEMFGTFSFVLLLGVFAWLDRKRDDAELTGVPETSTWSSEILLAGLTVLTFAFWANTHGSFMVGIAILACQTVGRLIEVAWKTHDVVQVLSDRRLHRWLWLTELAIAAALINPYGMDQLLNALEFSRNPNLPDVMEWKKLEFSMPEGVQMCLSWLLMLVLFRFSKQPVRPAEILMLAVLTYTSIANVRMIGWYGFIFAYAMLPHLAEMARRGMSWIHNQPGLISDEWWLRLQKRSHLITLFCILVGWYGFALSHLATPLLGGERRKPDRLYSAETPRGVSAFLRRHPPQGQIFNPQWWGDWLAWDGPPGLKVFMTTNAVHLAPHRYWKDYMGLASGGAGWQQQINKYNIETFIIHKPDQVTMDVEVRNLKDWKLVYEDDLAVIVTRDEALLKSLRAAAAAKGQAKESTKSEASRNTPPAAP